MHIDLIRPVFIEIKLFMDVTGGKHNLFYSGGDSISLDDINSWLAILQSMGMFKKTNTNKF